MLKKILPILLPLAILITACGPQPTPTMSSADIQGTSVAAAWTMVAATQAAIPTNTPLPPTPVPSPTPLPTFTPAPLIAPPTLPPLDIAATPTLAVIAPAAPADPNNCLKSLNLGEAGPAKNITVQNQTQSTVNVSLNLYKPNSFGQCGSISLQLAKGGTRTVKAASGYWYAFAWVLEPPSQVGVNFVINPGPATGGKIVITKDKVSWLGQ